MIKFGTDGWRGTIGDDFTFENVRIVAQAIADFLRSTVKGKSQVVIGYDCRFLSEDFAKEVGKVLAANRIECIISTSSVPTPVVSFHSLYKGYDLGVMITASHNPARFNGLKIKTSEGAAADKTLTDRIEKLLHKSKPLIMDYDKAMQSGWLKREDLDKDYIHFLRKFFAVDKIKKIKLKVLVDNMYGCGDSFAERVLGKGTITIDYLNSEFNPSFGGLHPEPIPKNLKELIKRVKQDGYDLGIALDGDADRIAAVSKKGEFISAQIILPLLALHMVNNRKVHKGIAKTVVGSNLIDVVSLSLDEPCYETPVGFKYISALFKEKLIAIGGEEAGGIGYAGYIPERDGTASFLMLLEMMVWQDRSFDGLLKDLRQRYGRWYYDRTSFSFYKLKKSLSAIPLPNKLLGEPVERINRTDGIKLISANNWLMFRKSGTEPIVRIYAEARTKKGLSSLLALGEELVKGLA